MRTYKRGVYFFSRIIILILLFHSLQAKEPLAYQLHELPPKVQAEIVKTGCSIPKLGYIYRRIKSGIIKGDFSAKTKDDFAFICRKGEFSKIVIIWSDGMPCPSEIHREKDDYFKSKRKDGAYSRNLRKVIPESLKDSLIREKRNQNAVFPIPVYPVTKNGEKTYVKLEIYGGDMRKEAINNANVDMNSLNYDGINDSYIDQGSIFTFCYQGKWHKTRGATQ